MTLQEPVRDNADPEVSPQEFVLRLPGFNGSLSLLLELARAHEMDLRRLDLLRLCDQLTRALQDERPTMSRKAEWTITAAWLLLLRSHLLLPGRDPRQPEAEAQATSLRERLLALDQAQALSLWLQARPQLGQEVRGPGNPTWDVVVEVPSLELDRVEFLWGCVALFEGNWSRPAAAETGVYAPPVFDLYRVDEARARVRERLAAFNAPVPLAAFLPDKTGDVSATDPSLGEQRIRHRSAWTTTLTACLELVKEGHLRILDVSELGREDQLAAEPRFREREPISSGRAQEAGDGSMCRLHSTYSWGVVTFGHRRYGASGAVPSRYREPPLSRESSTDAQFVSGPRAPRFSSPRSSTIRSRFLKTLASSAAGRADVATAHRPASRGADRYSRSTPMVGNVYSS